jgi:hypothetical protein
MKKIFYKFFSTSAAGLYMILFAVAIGAATFIENFRQCGKIVLNPLLSYCWCFLALPYVIYLDTNDPANGPHLLFMRR